MLPAVLLRWASLRLIFIHPFVYIPIFVVIDISSIFWLFGGHQIIPSVSGETTGQSKTLLQILFHISFLFVNVPFLFWDLFNDQKYQVHGAFI